MKTIKVLTNEKIEKSLKSVYYVMQEILRVDCNIISSMSFDSSGAVFVHIERKKDYNYIYEENKNKYKVDKCTSTGHKYICIEVGSIMIFAYKI